MVMSRTLHTLIVTRQCFFFPDLSYCIVFDNDEQAKHDSMLAAC